MTQVAETGGMVTHPVTVRALGADSYDVPGPEESLRPDAGAEWRVFEPGKRFRALGIVEQDEEGSFVAFSPSLPGAVSQGDSPDKALEGLCEALAGCIETYLAAGSGIPWDRDADFAGDAVLRRWIDIDV